MKDPELDILIQELEKKSDLTVADFDGIVQGLAFLLPKIVEPSEKLSQQIGTTDQAMHIADEAFPNWSVSIHGRANDKDGHWRCTLRKSDRSDSDAAIGSGRSPVLAQAILASVMRLAMIMERA